MEILVSLTNKGILEKLTSKYVDGLIFGSAFSFKYNYNEDEIRGISAYCIDRGLKQYISIDTFISEDDLDELDKYLEFISSLNIDGLYFNDLCIINMAKKHNLSDRLIYDPITLTTNSNDIGFYINKGMDVCLARELALDEIIEIIKKHPYKLDMQIFGHLRMSYSKRKFLSNYFKEIDSNRNVLNKENICLIEETRNYRLPIKETKYGTSIYTDYVFVMYEEFVYLNKLLKRGILDAEFIFDDVLFDVLRDIKRLTKDNAEFLKESLKEKYPQFDFSSGYLYQKTVDKKIENE